MAPPPPPPPPPICIPFFGPKKPKRRLSFSSAQMAHEGQSFTSDSSASLPRGAYTREILERKNSYSTSSTLTSAADNLTFRTDSEKYDEIPVDVPNVSRGNSKKVAAKLARSNTITGTKKSGWGYGWGLGKQKEKEKDDLTREMDGSGSVLRGTTHPSETNLPVYKPPTQPPTRSNTQASRATNATQSTQQTKSSQQTRSSQQTKSSSRTKSTSRTHRSHHSESGPVLNRPPIRSNESSSTLVGSAYERKVNDVSSVDMMVETSGRLEELRRLMEKENVDYYIVPSEDAHQSEYVAASDKRRQFISGFSGSAGTAIITLSRAFLITDARYWLQAGKQLDSNWDIVRVGERGQPRDWIEWLVSRIHNDKIGIDGRMISYEKAMLINSRIGPLGCKMVYPVQNLVDFVWKDKPPKSTNPVFLQPKEFTGEEARSKLDKLRQWIATRPPDIPSYSKTSEPKPSQIAVGTMIASLSGIAYILNLRGSDIPFCPLFHAYLFVGLQSTTIFLEASKTNGEVSEYLRSLGIEQRPYGDIWTFLRKREWGEGKVIISPDTSYTISLVLSHFRTTVLPSYVDEMLSIKNEVEIEGLRKAYKRDGAAYVQFLAWLEDKMLKKGYDVSEYEAAQRATEFRYHQKYFMGVAYDNISASGSNAALPHYAPRKATARMIDRNLPYLNDSGGQYRDGTCDTTRTIHMGRPDTEQIDAYTRVLQGHIAIDTAVFPEGTSGRQLDVLARRALWKDGRNYMHGTGHGFGSFLTVHEGPHGFSSDVPLMSGHVVTNEPGFYLEGKWGMRIESALVVRRVRTRHEFNGPVWLNFERLTCVPIQTRMVKESMLTKEEKQWLKEHNQRCYEKLEPFLKDDKRALKYLKKEADRLIGIAAPAPGGLTVDWH